MLLFGIENSLSVYLDNRKKDILILGEVPTDGLGDIAVTTEAKFSVNINNHRKTVCQDHNASNCILYANSIIFCMLYEFSVSL